MRKLKHYKSYLSRLENFASAHGIKIIYDEVPGDGVWQQAKNTIKIDDSLPNDETVATFLHELGHAIDDLGVKSITHSNSVYNAYEAVYNKSPTKNQLLIVLEAETAAWDYGAEIAKRLKIKLGAWYYKIQDSALKDYKNTLIKK